MAQLISVKLSRFDNSPWGFRLQGGKDFGTPLVVQKVNGGSPAEAAGLRAGDAVIKVNNTEMFSLRHKDAQDVIVRAGNNFEVTIQRGGSTWKPSVTPVSATLPTPQPTTPATHIIPVTKTSLAAKKQDGPLIGSGHNFSPKPFLNGNGEAPIKSIVNKQYNSPVGIYSEETIAETLSAQAEVLAGGVLGVNFKKNEKNYNAENSEVFKMVQEADKEPRSPEPAEPTTQSGVVTPTSPAVAGLTGLRHVSAPETKPQPTTPQTSLPPGQNICADCERLIVGVFVRIKEKNLHVECFKCSTCGTSLKNVGYYNINNKLYCDIHAKLVARQNPPAAGLAPVTIPTGKAPAGTISAALANVGANIPPLAPLSPCLNNHSSPLPFNCNRSNITIVNDSLHRLRLDNNGTSDSDTTAITTPPHSLVHDTEVARNGSNDAKTFTSTLIIQTGNEVGSTNNNDTLSYNNIINTKLDCEPGSVNEKYVGNICEFELTDDTDATTEEPTTGLRAIAAQPFPTKKQASSTNNIGGPKPFGSVPNAPSLVSASSLNSVNNTLPRPSSQSVTDSYHDEFDYYEVIQTRPEYSPTPSPQPPQPSVKSKSLAWPPPKAIEEITYPTASPLYINPNPALNEKYQKCAKERCKSQERGVEEEFEKRRDCSEEPTWRQSTESMEYASCPGPVYKRIQLYGVTSQRESRPIQRPPSRPASRESVRRSLTPTKITQPVPQPWTATVTTGRHLYQHAYQPPAPIICETVCQQRQSYQDKVTCTTRGCQREEACDREQSCERHYHAKQPCCRVKVCHPVCRPVCPPEPPKLACKPPERKVEVKEEPKSPVIETEVSFTLKRPGSRNSNVSATSPANVPSCPKNVEGHYDTIRETVEKDVGPLHVKKTTIYENTVEVVDPDEAKNEACETRRSAHLDKEVEHISGRREHVESANIISTAVETKQLVDKVKDEQFSHEQYASIEADGDRYQDSTKEIQIQSEIRQQEIEAQRLQSLREQVQVHQSLREQQVPEKRQPSQTLQERRLSAKFKQQDFSSQQQTFDSSCAKKHVQFVTDLESGAQALPPTTIKNQTAKQWQSEMCKALSTAPIPSYCPIVQVAANKGQVVEESYDTERSYCTMEEDRPMSPFVRALTIVPDNHKAHYSTTVTTRQIVVGQPKSKPPASEPRPATSPFRDALTTASDRLYTPLGFYDHPDQTYAVQIEHEAQPGDCSETPTIAPASAADGYCAPAEILYTGTRAQAVKQERSSSRNANTPQPLPMPPSDYHFRDSSRSPARSRSQTPNGRTTMMGLKKPDAIPPYQKNLVIVQQAVLDGQAYDHSRTPTPNPGRAKSPAPGSPESPACVEKVEAPKESEDQPPKISAPTVKFAKKPYEVQESVEYHEEDGTSCTRVAVKDDKSSRNFVFPENASKTGNYMEKEEETTEMIERSAKTGVVAYTKDTDTNVRPCSDNSEPPPAPVKTETSKRSTYTVPKKNTAQVTFTCPIGSRQSNRFPKTGVCVLPPPPPSIGKAVVVERSETAQKSSCREVLSQSSQRSVSQSEQSAFRETKSCDSSIKSVERNIMTAVSPSCNRGACGQPSGLCGRRCGSALLDICSGPCAEVCAVTCNDGSVCVAPCSASRCSSVLCSSSLKNRCPFARSPTVDLPFPQIPLPYDDDNVPRCPSTPNPNLERNDLSFQPIHKPRTNLGSQLTQLVHKTNQQTVQVCKPQAQCSSQILYHTQSQYSISAPVSKTQNLVDPPNLSSHPDLGSGVGGTGANSKSGSVAGNTAPKRGRGVLTQQGGPGSRIPLCGHCNSYVRGPFITALGNIWCPDHFVCVNSQCRRPLQDIGFVEEKGQLYCEYCFEQFIAPPCNKCSNKIKGACLNAIGKHFHPECFNCSYCGKLFGNNPFFLEEGLPYCESDWNELFTTKCFACGFPVEAGDRWVEALSNNYHSQCFNCTMCKKNLEGQSFYAKGGRPFCKNHAR